MSNEDAAADHPWLPDQTLADRYLAAMRDAEPGALAATAVRTGSIGVRHLLARAATGSSATLAELLGAARSGDRAFFVDRRRSLDPGALADLARVIALQQRQPSDLDDALALYDRLRATFGARRVARIDQGLHVQLAFVTGRPERAVTLLRGYPLAPFDVRTAVRLDLANPFVGGTGRRWWRGFARLLPDAGLRLRDRPRAGLSLSARPDVVPFDRLVVAPGRHVDGPTITVVVTSFRPDGGLLTAVRSILDQTWRDVEVLVVDDASPPEHDGVLTACARLDPRVRVIRLPVNGGTYVARNVGLDEATGDFVTFQDSDDWSHPFRLERQVAPLLRGGGPVASTSEGIAVSDNLAVTRLGQLRHARLNPSSLMLRRAAVLGRVGYFDEVRRGADSEMIERLGAAFGAGAVRHLDAEPLALIRMSPGSLSRGEVRAGWLHPARAAYLTGYRQWHARVRAGEADPVRPRQPTSRPFAAPAHMLGQSGAPQTFDVVFVADWTARGRAPEAAVEEIAALAAQGLRLAVAQLHDVRTLTRHRPGLHPRVQALVDDGTVDLAYLDDETHARLTVVRRPEVLQFAAGTPCRLRAGQVLLVVEEPPADYLPGDCDAAARELFGGEPVWAPRDPVARQAFDDVPVRLTPFDLPEAVAVRAPRRGPAGDRPVVGADGLIPPELAASLLAAGADVRLRQADVRVGRAGGVGRARGGRGAAGRAALPPGCLVYEAGDLSRGDFVDQLDFYLHFAGAGEGTRLALAALAAGCVIVAASELATTYGAAAVYCAPEEVTAVVARLHGDRAAYEGMSERAQDAVAGHGPDAFVAAVAELLHPSSVDLGLVVGALPRNANC